MANNLVEYDLTYLLLVTNINVERFVMKQVRTTSRPMECVQNWLNWKKITKVVFASIRSGPPRKENAHLLTTATLSGLAMGKSVMTNNNDKQTTCQSQLDLTWHGLELSNSKRF